ncbi:MAG TPA: hypothetical protein VFN70_18050 [Burkholderiales bacterium]|nr:hypothetical protein [Burkholderiales bacterium]
MTPSHLAICGALSMLVGFLAGWRRGRRDLEVDTQPALDELVALVHKIPTHCACGAKLRAACSAGCTTHQVSNAERPGR